MVEDGEHEGLVEGVGVREILELKSFIEEWIQGFSVNFRLKLFLAFLGWEHEDLESCKISLAAENAHKLERTMLWPLAICRPSPD